MDHLELDFIRAMDKAPVSADAYQFAKLNPKEKLILLGKTYGREWVDWDNVETLFLAIERDFWPGFATNGEQEQRDMLNALKTMCRSDDFWDDSHIFEKCCLALDEATVIFQLEQPLSPAQCLIGLEVAAMIRGDTYDEDVQEYIAKCCKDRGLVFLPGKLSIAQDELDKMKNDVSLKDMTKNIWTKVFKAKANELGEIPEIDELELDEDNATDWQICKLYSTIEYTRLKLGGVEL